MNPEPIDPKPVLADNHNATQDTPVPTPTMQGPRHAGRPPSQRKTPAGRYQQFAETLAGAMNRNGLSASEVARRVWGEGTDRRGHKVAKNRDRIGHYLSGNSYPEPENLRKLAEAVGLTVEELATPEPVRVRVTTPHEKIRDFIITILPDRGKVRVRGQIDRVIDWDSLKDLLELLRDDKPAEENGYQLGDVVNGTK